MGYMHINNLYKDQGLIDMFKECYAMEKVHGTSANIGWHEGKLTFFSGGEKHENFIKLFDHEKLTAHFTEMGVPSLTVYGEAYGGRCQGMSGTYGQELRFIAFEVRIGESWLNVEKAFKVVNDLGLEFVPFERVPTDINILNAIRDRPSDVAIRRGCGPNKQREGIVIRPIEELIKSNGDRMILKHKGESFRETKTVRKIEDPAKLAVLVEANAIADEWVTNMRLTHILQKFPEKLGIEMTGDVVRAMIEDIYREGAGEIVESHEAKRAIGTKTAQMFKKRTFLNTNIH